jgi:hypothetical protein
MDKLEQAIGFIKSGDKGNARQLLIEVIRSDPNNEMAWLWMSAVVEDAQQKRECLEKVLNINPDNAQAQVGLSKLEHQDRDIPHIPKPEQAEILTEAQAPNFNQVDRYAVQAKIEALRNEQDLALGILGGLIGGGIGAVLWAVITYITEYQIGWMAIGVGFLVGYGSRLLGKGIDRVFGYVGGGIALLSVVMGNFFASLGFLAKALEVGYFEMLFTFNYAMTFELLATTFSVMDILFYAIAVYQGYKFSFRKVTKAELLGGVQ